MSRRSGGPGRRGQVVEAGQVHEGVLLVANHLLYIPQPPLGGFDGGPCFRGATEWDKLERLNSAERKRREPSVRV